MRSAALFLLACLLAGVTPLVPQPRDQQQDDPAGPFPGWIQQWEGSALAPLPLSRRETRFANGFPGKIGRFTDGRRQFIVRWVSGPTRKLHPASDCFRGTGYTVSPMPVRIDDDGRRWGCFEAARATERLQVCELVFTDAGEAWPDISSWYWAATMRQSSGPWWVITIVERTT